MYSFCCGDSVDLSMYVHICTVLGTSLCLVTKITFKPQKHIHVHNESEDPLQQF